MADLAQILVVGGGPADFTAAGLQARQGFDVVLLEKERTRIPALGRRERDELDLQAAFDRIVTGIEDLSAAQEVYGAVRAHLNGAESDDRNPLANLNRVHEQRQSPFTPANAVRGRYLVMPPQLGLGRFTEPALEGEESQ